VLETGNKIYSAIKKHDEDMKKIEGKKFNDGRRRRRKKWKCFFS